MTFGSSNGLSLTHSGRGCAAAERRGREDVTYDPVDQIGKQEPRPPRRGSSTP